MLKLAPGDILLTAGFGGPDANWRDKMLSKLILFHEAVQGKGFQPTRSHAELICDSNGGTFAARWRTRYRENGLVDYIGSNITIGRSLSMTEDLFLKMCEKSKVNDWDGNIYPVHRIITQLVGTYIFPWLVKWGFLKTGMCSELVANVYHAGADLGFNYAFVKSGWRGITPADLEEVIRHGDEFEVVFDGTLTKEIFIESNLPLFQYSDPDYKEKV